MLRAFGAPQFLPKILALYFLMKSLPLISRIISLVLSFVMFYMAYLAIASDEPYFLSENSNENFRPILLATRGLYYLFGPFGACGFLSILGLIFLGLSLKSLFLLRSKNGIIGKKI